MLGWNQTEHSVIHIGALSLITFCLRKTYTLFNQYQIVRNCESRPEACTMNTELNTEFKCTRAMFAHACCHTCPNQYIIPTCLWPRVAEWIQFCHADASKFYASQFLPVLSSNWTETVMLMCIQANVAYFIADYTMSISYLSNSVQWRQRATWLAQLVIAHVTCLCWGVDSHGQSWTSVAVKIDSLSVTD